ncbi:hypothetical protein ABMA32_06805 [Mesorhizobium sp. VNQ89]|uniref:hypothetical protein n=1 Tax=Mesorhizobium quangtriensis TaxID=3157709 RepID=UPI0032B74608
MKTISTTVQIAALAICFAAQFHPAGVTGIPGTRKAMQTLEIFTGQVAEQPVHTLAFSAPR